MHWSYPDGNQHRCGHFVSRKRKPAVFISDTIWFLAIKDLFLSCGKKGIFDEPRDNLNILALLLDMRSQNFEYETSIFSCI